MAKTGEKQKLGTESEPEPRPKLDEKVDSKQKVAQETAAQGERGKNEVAIEDV